LPIHHELKMIVPSILQSIPIAHISGTGINGLQWSETEFMRDPGSEQTLQ